MQPKFEITEPMRKLAIGILELEDGLAGGAMPQILSLLHNPAVTDSDHVRQLKMLAGMPQMANIINLTQAAANSDGGFTVSFKGLKRHEAEALLEEKMTALRKMVQEANKTPGESALNTRVDEVLNQVADKNKKDHDQGHGHTRRGRHARHN